MKLGYLVRRWEDIDGKAFHSLVLEASVSQLWPSPSASEIYLFLYLLVIFSSLWIVSSKRKRIAYHLCVVYDISRFLDHLDQSQEQGGYSANQH